jgi:hypothetical protein
VKSGVRCAGRRRTSFALVLGVALVLVASPALAQGPHGHGRGARGHGHGPPAHAHVPGPPAHARAPGRPAHAYVPGPSPHTDMEQLQLLPPRHVLRALDRLADRARRQEEHARRNRQRRAAADDAAPGSHQRVADPSATTPATTTSATAAAPVRAVAAASPAVPPTRRTPRPATQSAVSGPPTALLSDDLSNFGLPLAMTAAFVLFLLVESRFGGQPTKLTDARVAARRPLHFR